MKYWDCLIVGAGPSGGMVALTVASGGMEVLILERKKRVGWPVHCGEAVSEDAFLDCGISMDTHWILREVKGAKMIMPNGKEILFPRRGMCIRRDRFDQWLLVSAQKAGAELRLGMRVEEVAKESGYWVVRSGAEVFRSKILVMASGANSKIEGVYQMRPSEVTILGYQFKFMKSSESLREYLEFYHGEYFHPGYGWIFDRGSEVSIGMGGYRDVRGLLKGFCVSKGFDLSQRISSHFGYIPAQYPEEIFEKNGVLWVGDAAGLVHPLTRGGVHLALYSGKTAGEIITEALNSKDLRNLRLYQKRISQLVRFLKQLWRQNEWFYSIPNDVWNVIGDLMDGNTYDKIPWARLPLVLCRDPRIYPWLVRFYGIQRNYKKTERFSW